MKKIFAIALALVMVLSMASAFAMTCTNVDWACATTTYNCGTATVEVVPYVVANDCDGKSASYVESSCAAAVYGQDVYYAVKVNVPADINEEWFDAAKLEVKLTDLTGAALAANGFVGVIANNADFGEKALTYYAFYNGTSEKWELKNAADDNFVLDNVVMSAEVDNAKTAKVCATLTSAVNPVETGVFIDVASYKIKWNDDGNIVVHNGKNGDDKKAAVFYINDSDKIEKVGYFVGSEEEETFVDFGFLAANGTASGYCAPYDWLKAVMEYFKLNFRDTCYTEKAFKANFGWDNEVKSCFTWSANATSIVDAECVVAIPKTGDASVLAWLF